MNARKTKSVDVKVKPVVWNISHHGFAKYARDFLKAYLDLTKREAYYSPVPYYLLCRSIELGIKALILNKDISKITSLHKKTYAGHDLIEALTRVEGLGYVKLLSKTDKKQLAKTSKFYGNDGKFQKGFEYFDGNIMNSMLRGYDDLPSLKHLEDISRKIISRLEREDILLMLN